MSLPTPTHTATYPHEGGCRACATERRCNVCGRRLKSDMGRCTNGRCRDCHGACCTPGGSTTPGHSFGTREVAEKQAKKVAGVRPSWDFSGTRGKA